MPFLFLLYRYLKQRTGQYNDVRVVVNSSPYSSGGDVVLALNGPGEARDGGRDQVEGGVDLLVLLPHVHHHPALQGGDHLLPHLLPAHPATAGLQDGDRRPAGAGSTYWGRASPSYDGLLESCNQSLLDSREEREEREERD